MFAATSKFAEFGDENALIVGNGGKRKRSATEVPKKVTEVKKVVETKESLNGLVAVLNSVLVDNVKTAATVVSNKTKMANFMKESVVAQFAAIDSEVASSKLVMRKDQDLHADVGLHKALTDIFLSYNIQWLKAGIEAVWGVDIVNDKTDYAVKKFILDKLLLGQSAAMKKVLLITEAESTLKEDLRKAFLRNCLCLIILLDHAKCQHVLTTSVLFRTESVYKTSKEVLGAFCKEFLKGEGDINRHFERLSISLKFCQLYLHEFSFGISNIAVDLRDGVRFCRLIALLSGKMSLLDALRAPAHSRLQKVHNVNAAISQFATDGAGFNFTLCGDGPKKFCTKVEASHIVDGHRDYTILLLCRIIERYMGTKISDVHYISPSAMAEVKQLHSQIECRMNVIPDKVPVVNMLSKKTCKISSSDDSEPSMKTARVQPMKQRNTNLSSYKKDFALRQSMSFNSGLFNVSNDEEDYVSDLLSERNKASGGSTDMDVADQQESSAGVDTEEAARQKEIDEVARQHEEELCMKKEQKEKEIRMKKEQIAEVAARALEVQRQATADAIRKKQESKAAAKALDAEKKAAKILRLKEEEAEDEARDLEIKRLNEELEAQQRQVEVQELEKLKTAKLAADAIYQQNKDAVEEAQNASTLSNGWIKLQARFRGGQTRAIRKRRLALIFNRLEKASVAAKKHPNNTLGNRTKEALHVIHLGPKGDTSAAPCPPHGQSVSMQDMLDACITLETSTELSRQCCDLFVDTQATHILLSLIQSCNRSSTHQEILRHALNVLLNVARHDNLAHFIAKGANAVHVVVDLMQMFRDKKSVFSLVCELTCRLISSQKETKDLCNSADIRKRLDGIYSILDRKYRLEARVRAMAAAAAGEAPLNNCLSPCKGKFMASKEPIDCIRLLMKLLA